MEKIKKELKALFILLLSMVMFSSPAIEGYGIDMSLKSTLRIPMSMGIKERQTRLSKSLTRRSFMRVTAMAGLPSTTNNLNTLVEKLKRKFKIKPNQEKIVFFKSGPRMSIYYRVVPKEEIIINITSNDDKLKRIVVTIDSGEVVKINIYEFDYSLVSSESDSLVFRSQDAFLVRAELDRILELPVLVKPTKTIEKEKLAAGRNLERRIRELQESAQKIKPKRDYISGPNELVTNEVFQGKFGITRPGEDRTPFLKPSGLASCVALSLWDESTKTGLVAHFDVATDVPASFTIMLNMLRRAGVDINNLKAKIIGGWTESSEKLILDIQDELKDISIPIVQQDILGPGGNEARSIIIDVRTGQVYYYTGLLPTDSRIAGREPLQFNRDPKGLYFPAIRRQLPRYSFFALFQCL